MAGIWNLNQTCYVNVILQSLPCIENFMNSLRSHKASCLNTDFCVECQICDICIAITTDLGDAVSKRCMRTFCKEVGINPNQPGDPREFLSLLSRTYLPQLQVFININMRRVNTCSKCLHKSENNTAEIYLTLPDGFNNVSEALDSYFRSEYLYEAQCSQCKERDCISRQNHMENSPNNIFVHVPSGRFMILPTFYKFAGQAYITSGFIEMRLFKFGKKTTRHYLHYKCVGNMWIQFNDEQVTLVNLNKAYRAYLIIFRKAGTISPNDMVLSVRKYPISPLLVAKLEREERLGLALGHSNTEKQLLQESRLNKIQEVAEQEPILNDTNETIQYTWDDEERLMTYLHTGQSQFIPDQDEQVIGTFTVEDLPEESSSANGQQLTELSQSEQGQKSSPTDVHDPAEPKEPSKPESPTKKPVGKPKQPSKPESPTKNPVGKRKAPSQPESPTKKPVGKGTARRKPTKEDKAALKRIRDLSKQWLPSPAPKPLQLKGYKQFSLSKTGRIIKKVSYAEETDSSDGNESQRKRGKKRKRSPSPDLSEHLSDEESSDSSDSDKRRISIRNFEKKSSRKDGKGILPKQYKYKKWYPPKNDKRTIHKSFMVDGHMSIVHQDQPVPGDCILCPSQKYLVRQAEADLHYSSVHHKSRIRFRRVIMLRCKCSEQDNRGSDGSTRNAHYHCPICFKPCDFRHQVAKHLSSKHKINSKECTQVMNSIGQ